MLYENSYWPLFVKRSVLDGWKGSEYACDSARKSPEAVVHSCSTKTIFWKTSRSSKKNHYVKNVRIWKFSDPCFPAVGINTERYGVSLRIQSEYGRIRTRKAPNTYNFYVVKASAKFSSGLQLYLKRDSGTGFFLWALRTFSQQLLRRKHPSYYFLIFVFISNMTKQE